MLEMSFANDITGLIRDNQMLNEVFAFVNCFLGVKRIKSEILRGFIENYRIYLAPDLQVYQPLHFILGKLAILQV